MNYKKKLVEYYCQRAKEYEQIYFRDVPDRRKEIDDEAINIKALAKDKTVLDIPCGTGYWTKIISESAKKIVAADISLEMIEMARSKEYQIPVEFVQCDLNFPPFEPHSFDLVVLGFWFSHHPKQDYEALFKILKSLLKENGLIWMIDNNPPAEGAVSNSVGKDEFGNNQKKRWLDNGEEFIIIKNYFEKEDLSRIFVQSFDIQQLTHNKYYWSALLQS